MAAWVIRAVTSWASSTTTTSYSGIIGMPSIASIASRLWLVITSWASAARSLACSAKHSSPNAQRAFPRHSRALTETCRQSRSVCRGAPSRSPVPLSFASSSAHFRSSSTCLPIEPSGTSTSTPCSSGTPSRIRCRQA